MSTKNHKLIQKILIPKSVYDELIRKAKRYDELLANQKIEDVPAISDAEYTGKGVVADQNICQDTDTDSETVDNGKEFDPAIIASKLSYNKGLEEPLKAPIVLPIPNEESESAVKLSSTSSTKELSKTDLTEREESAPVTASKQSTDNLLLGVWDRNRNKARRLLKHLANHRQLIRWNSNGEITLEGKKVNMNMKKLLPILFQRCTKTMPHLSDILKVLCKCGADKYISNENIAHIENFKWYFLDY